MDIRLHPPVLVFVVAMAVVATLVSGLLPAIQSAKLDVSSILKDESHSASSLRVGRMSRTIVGLELALSSALLVGAGFITKSVVKLRSVDPRFVTANVFTARITATSTDSMKQRAFFESVERELAATSECRRSISRQRIAGKRIERRSLRDRRAHVSK